MRWPNLNWGFETRLRVVLLGIAVLSSVVLPYSILRKSANDTLNASAWVVHSAEVKQTIHELRYNLSELESLLLSRFAGMPQAEGRSTYATVRERIAPLIARLTELTHDDADQQNRIGTLEAVVDGRLELFDEAMQKLDGKNYDAADEALKQAAKMFGSRSIAREILAAEDDLYHVRTERMERAKRIAAWIVAAALFAQLVLLSSIIFVSERHAMHRQSAEKSARLAVERSRIIVQTLREPIAVVDTSLRVLMCNEAFSEVYGAPAGPAGSSKLEQYGNGAWNNPLLLQRLLDVGARGREIWDYELTQHDADGNTRIVLVNARRMDLSDDAEIADERTILLTVSDVTARKRYEQQISELNTELEAKVAQVSEINRELESFSYSVSHDLRAPLRHIAGFADKLGTHIAHAADDRSRHYLGVIGDAARRMSNLIEDLLEHSRLGRSTVRLSAVDMNELVAEIREMFIGAHDGRTIEWRIGDLPMVVGDEGMLRRVWQNLISNAIKYTGQRERALIEIGSRNDKPGEVVYFVRDNGIGFDMAYAGKLFGVFQRLHKATEFPGTGIGLANVRRIIGRLGGRAWAEAEPDKGATLYFALPALAGAVSVHEEKNEP